MLILVVNVLAVNGAVHCLCSVEEKKCLTRAIKYHKVFGSTSIYLPRSLCFFSRSALLQLHAQGRSRATTGSTEDRCAQTTAVKERQATRFNRN